MTMTKEEFKKRCESDELSGTIYFPTEYQNSDGGKFYLHITFSG